MSDDATRESTNVMNRPAYDVSVRENRVSRIKTTEDEEGCGLEARDQRGGGLSGRHL